MITRPALNKHGLSATDTKRLLKLWTSSSWSRKEGRQNGKGEVSNSVLFKKKPKLSRNILDTWHRICAHFSLAPGKAW